ncbi:hypothetical protein [Phaffia rhodozyma]|uniref:Uncharacterized protein n=1 Tax=Phaffia rhodozyma TaxID=264483 RepID=A0A0F7SXP1_PHARH|nr:hypothetical protein [Phaffia rhodozyma]
MFYAPLFGLAAISFSCFSADALPLSLNCTQSLALAISADPESTCFATPALEVFLPTLIGSTNTSIAAPLATYLEAVCPAPLCTDEQIEQTFATIGAGCSDLFAELGVSPTVLGGIVPLLPTVKEYVCLEANSNSAPPEYCVVDVTDAIQTFVGQNITVDLVSSLVSGNVTLAGILPERNKTELEQISPLVCTDCFRAYIDAITVAVNDTEFIEDNLNSTVGVLFAQATVLILELCGFEFFNVSAPVNVYNGTNITLVV